MRYLQEELIDWAKIFQIIIIIIILFPGIFVWKNARDTSILFFNIFFRFLERILERKLLNSN